MAIKPRVNQEDKKNIWKRCQEGSSLSDIGREVDRPPASIFGYLRQHGGFQPAQRKRPKMYLCALKIPK